MTTFVIKPYDEVYLLSGSDRYHREMRYGWAAGHLSACGLIVLSDATFITELEAIEAENRPCGRCWNRLVQRRLDALRPLLSGGGES